MPKRTTHKRQGEPSVVQRMKEAGTWDEEAYQAYAWEVKSGTLSRFTTAELLRELKERANRKVVLFNSRRV
jgi:hypothetical protein